MTPELLLKLKNQYQTLFPDGHGVAYSELNDIENKIGKILPNDFREVASFYNGGIIGGYSLYTITSDAENEYGIVNRTEVLREVINLPKKYLPLYCEYGLIYLNLDNDSPNFGQVVYCDNEEAQNLFNPTYPKSPYWTFPSFFYFFEFLIKEEEKIRKE